MLAPTCSTMSRIQSIPYTIPFVYRYSTYPRFDRRYTDTLFNLVTANLFTHSVTHHPVINSLITLCTLWWCPTEWAQRYLSVTRSDKSQSRFVPTQQTLSEIPVVHLYSHPVTLWRLVHPKALLWYPGVTQSHGLRKWNLTLEKLLANELHDLVLCLGLGLVHHIILLMMWSRYQRHPMSMVRKP